MRIDYELEVDMNIPRIMASLDDPAFGMFAAETWYKLYEDYVPWNSGTLYDTVRLQPWEIDHIVPYANQVYTTNKHYRRDKHPKATGRWSDAAEPAERDKLERSLQNYIDIGRLHVND